MTNANVLDLEVARAVAQARMMESALHDPGPWFIGTGDVQVAAARVVTPSRVVFLAYFEEIPEGDRSAVLLYCRGQMVSARNDFRVPDRGAFTVEWSVGGAAPREPSLASGL